MLLLSSDHVGQYRVGTATGGQGQASAMKGKYSERSEENIQASESQQSVSEHRGQEIGMPDHSPKPLEKASQAGQLGGNQ